MCYSYLNFVLFCPLPTTKKAQKVGKDGKDATSTATWATVFITNDHILLLCDLRTLVPNSPDICLKFPQNPTHMT